MKKLLVTLTTLILGACDSNETFTFRLIGKWKWTYTCGGITGACGYSDKNSTRTLEITKDKMIETWNDGSITTTTYSISSKTNFEDYSEYIVKFDNEGTQRIIKATKNTLDINDGGVWTGYKK